MVINEIWLAYLVTVLIFMITPGPSHLLMLSNCLKHGVAKAKTTAFGDLTANAIQMTLASFGLASVLIRSHDIFIVIKWAGVGYLVYLGMTHILRKRSFQGQINAAKADRGLFWQGFITSAANPKAIIFFAALFPQFLNVDEVILPQLLLLGLTYIVIDGLFLATYGLFAEWIQRRFKKHLISSLDVISGSFLIVAAVLLALKRI